MRLGGEYTIPVPASLWAAEGVPEVGVALLAAGLLGSASSRLVSCISRLLPRFSSSGTSLSEHFLWDQFPEALREKGARAARIPVQVLWQHQFCRNLRCCSISPGGVVALGTRWGCAWTWFTSVPSQG